MEQFRSIEEVLDFAISEEMGAYQFYTDLAGKAKDAAMKEVFLEYAAQEIGHKQQLEAIRDSGKLPPARNIADLKLSDILKVPQDSSEMDYQQALVFAMKKEKAAFLMYNLLAQVYRDSEFCEVFKRLAQQEAEHKLKFEIEYDQAFLSEN